MKRRRSIPEPVRITLQRFVGGGQTIGELPNGKKIFVWGGLPGEDVTVQPYRSKASYAEGTVTAVHTASPQRQVPRDPASFLSTSPWQVMDLAAELTAKAGLVVQAYALHHCPLPGPPAMYSDGQDYGYRNKVEFSWWWDNDTDQLDLAFFRRGSHGKVPVEGTSLARPEINTLACHIRDYLRQQRVAARSLKTLLIRCDQAGNCVWQLYVKDRNAVVMEVAAAAALPAQGGEIIYSDPRSPASRISQRLVAFGDVGLADTIDGTGFGYAAEGFFQVNIPVYGQALHDMRAWLDDRPLLDLYSGVGSIGLTIGRGDAPLTLIELDPYAYRELERNTATRNRQRPVAAAAVLAAAEKALDHIDCRSLVVVDPPRAGLHQAVVERLVAVRPPRLLYLSCNPVTQARDVALLTAGGYRIVAHHGYDFFPHTPHIEYLVVLKAV